MNGEINVNKIAEYLQTNGLTKNEFCKRCEICASTLKRIMRKGNVRLTAVVKVARGMKINLSELFE